MGWIVGFFQTENFTFCHRKIVLSFLPFVGNFCVCILKGFNCVLEGFCLEFKLGVLTTLNFRNQFVTSDFKASRDFFRDEISTPFSWILQRKLLDSVFTESLNLAFLARRDFLRKIIFAFSARRDFSRDEISTPFSWILKRKLLDSVFIESLNLAFSARRDFSWEIIFAFSA